VPIPTRRSVLLGALAAGALTACTDNSPATPGVPDPDEALVREALAAETSLLGLLSAVTRPHARRARELAGTLAVHTAHVQLLGHAVEDTPSPTTTPGAAFVGDDKAAYLTVARAEDALGLTLRRCAFRAESGPFARVLAGMAAAAAQQAVALRELA
jgi:hypothetical protein